MSICDRCVHSEVCGLEGNHEDIAFCSEIMPKTGEYQQDHEILKAYSDGANEMLDQIRAEIDKIYERENHSFDCLDALDELKEFIDKYKAEEGEQIPDLRETAEEAAEAIQNLTKAGISQEDIESIDWPFYDPDTRRIRFSKPENIQKLKEYERDDMAIKALEQEPCKVSEYDKDHIWYKGSQYISLRRFLEVKAEPKTKWIPVSERLPEFNGRYLVSLPSRLIHEKYNVMILNFAKSLYGVPNKEAWYEVDSNMVLNEVPSVIAWMPLPERYGIERYKAEGSGEEE